MTQEPAHQERRRHSRFPLGLPVKIHVDGIPRPITAELIDIAEEGVRMRWVGDRVHLDQRAAFGFVIPGQHVCVAKGRVVRIDEGGQFVLSLERANDAFRGFLTSLSM